MVYERSPCEFFYYCNVIENWVQCSEDDYYMKHDGKSFTKIVEPDVNSATFPHQTKDQKHGQQRADA